ncbi:unnamed protein product [Hyaloperonospora brassicae]|uniref:1-phosphatidylinositol 4-kinase n=1 Tax=Hyaloperonospora brassicae TaxID=162125 RepID=A0AAV0UXX8_HYABA|nr:unnamed protein product [Hyaloperonospora brassicae]
MSEEVMDEPPRMSANPSEDGEGSQSADDAATTDDLRSPAAGGSAPSSTRAANSQDHTFLRASGPLMSESAAMSSSELLGPLGVERDGLGIKGYLYMRDEGVTYHRMKRFYCRCVGVNFSRFASRDTASAMIAAVFSAEVQKVEEWDGKGLWHTYHHSFKLSFTSGVVFNMDADSDEDKYQWIEYIETALQGTEAAVEKWTAHASVCPTIMELTPGGLTFTEKKYHSSRFAMLRHLSTSYPVRVCMGCYRVQRFVLWLGMLLQRLYIAQTEEEGVEKPVLSDADEEEVEALIAIFEDDAFGISDVIQVLHLHRHGCDEAYAYAVNKLLMLSASNLSDFEFFLPQIFHMWLTVDWTNNNIKAALLFRVLCYATQLHIRLATSIYWLTRAAVDDSCGWGFGQSELYVPDFLYHKMSRCKLLMMNVELQISRGDWTFEVDKDLPASTAQTAIIKCLFDPVPSLGVSCSLVMHFQKTAVKMRLLTIAKDEGTIFTTRARAPTLIFFEVARLTTAFDKSAWLYRGRSLLFGGQIDKPCDSESSPNIGGIKALPPTSEARVVKNAIEMATSSDIAQVIAMDTFSGEGNEQDNDDFTDEQKRSGYDDLASSAGEENDLQELRDRIPSDPPPSLASLASDKKKRNCRDRPGSLMNSTSKSLDSIIASCAESIKSRRKRSISEGSGFNGSEKPHWKKQGSMPNDIENFTDEQLISIAQNMVTGLLESNPSGNGTFTGKQVVEWMTENEIVSNAAHALWLGSELLRSGALETKSNLPGSAESFEANNETLYHLKEQFGTQSSEHSQTLMSDALPISPQGTKKSTKECNDSMFRTSSRIMLKPQEVKVDVADLADAVGANLIGTTAESAPNSISKASKPLKDYLTSPFDERPSNALNVHDGSFILKFEPDVAMAAMDSVEQTLQQFVLLQGVESATQLSEDLHVLREQLSIVYEYVIAKRKRLHVAVESAFGESFEEKKERLRDTSSHVAALQPKDWDCVALIVKSNDDLRQEVLCQQIIRQLQDIFQSADLPLRLLPYEIVATSASTGMIEYVKNAVSLDALKKRGNYTNLADHFVKTYGQADSPAYKTAMTNFVRSMAAYSLACYFLQIKDRHNGNIMIDSDGHVIHIDFGFILGIAPGGRFSLETAPFKLTSEMVDAMGGTQSDYFKAYVIFLIQGFLALQQHADTILMMIAIMAQESSCPCFLSQNPRDILSATKLLFRLDYDQSQVIKHVISLVRRSHSSYRTRQYDVFQRMTNGILP